MQIHPYNLTYLGSSGTAESKFWLILLVPEIGSSRNFGNRIPSSVFSTLLQQLAMQSLYPCIWYNYCSVHLTLRFLSWLDGLSNSESRSFGLHSDIWVNVVRQWIGRCGHRGTPIPVNCGSPGFISNCGWNIVAPQFSVVTKALWYQHCGWTVVRALLAFLMHNGQTNTKFTMQKHQMHAKNAFQIAQRVNCTEQTMQNARRIVHITM